LNISRKIYPLFLLIGLHLNAISQTRQAIDTAQKDLMDVLVKLFNSKAKISEEKKLNFSFVPAAGYAMHTGWAGMVTGNVGFYNGGNANGLQKISSVLMDVTYTENRQIMVPLYANIWTKGNKYNILIDHRFIKYPSKVFGLEDQRDIADGYFVDYNGMKLHQTVLRNLSPNFYVGLGYYFDALWNVRELDPPAGFKTAFQEYGIQNKNTAAGPVFQILYDSRLNTINPLNGMYASVAYRNNLKWMGSDTHWQSLQLDLRKYVRFPAHSNNTLAFWNLNWFTLNGRPPFLMLPSNGWDDSYNSGRGYIQGRFRGRNMLYAETEYRFNITQNGLLGATMFINGQTYSSNTFSNYNPVKIGYGLGLRIKLNKFSGANICIDYGFGKNGSRGFAVNLGEIF
jgi:Omp85 superfamily domain